MLFHISHRSEINITSISPQRLWQMFFIKSTWLSTNDFRYFAGTWYRGSRLNKLPHNKHRRLRDHILNKLLQKYLTRRDTGFKTVLYFCLNSVIESLILIMGNYLKAIVLKNHKINTSFVRKNLWPLGANTTGFDLIYL